ncbi:Protein of unknown function DUF620 [Dillenia turbinata]|uniref:Uncharacterized protein n=1 Tax=Dillenia turbinata TaxID=194707 RepID=A0AAN8W4X6_9MAGN
MSRLAPLSEEPVNEEEDYRHDSSNSSYSSSSSLSSSLSKKRQLWKNWVKSHFSLLFNKKSDLKVLLSVLGCPLFPLSVHHLEDPSPQISSSAQYIIQHFTAATGCRKLEGNVKNIFVTGKVTMAMVEDINANASAAVAKAKVAQKGCFVMWQMVPNKWLVELVVGGHKVIAGSDGKIAWRHTPWLAAHAAKGGVRPLRRALQASFHFLGLDPLVVSSVFSLAQYMGEKRVLGMDCFVLKLSADHTDLAERSDSTAEMIKHAIFGYFSQRSGLLVYLEDSYLTRIQSPGACPTYWETTMRSKIEDYRTVDGVMIAHGGHTSAIITRFGDSLRTGSAITRMEENWVIDDLAFNVAGLSMDCFIAPEEVQRDYPDENLDWRSPLHR